MDQEKDICPVNDSGNHRYFIFKVVEVFEVAPTAYHSNESIAKGHVLYEKVEYAISGCNCGSSIKQRVKQQ